MNSDLNQEETKIAPVENYLLPLKDTYQLAAGMLVSDLKLVVLLYIILVLPNLIGVVYGEIDQNSFIIETSKRLLELVFLYIVTRKWIRHFSISDYEERNATLFSLILAGFALWLLFAVPAVLVILDPGGIGFPALLLFFPACFIGLRYFFYFFPICCSVDDVGQAFKQAAALTEQDRWLPVRALIAPLGISTLLTALSLTPAPDGRSQEIMVFASLWGDLFWVFSTYISLALVVILADAETWKNWELVEDRKKSVLEIMLTGPQLFARALEPRTGIFLLVLGLFVMVGNLSRAEMMQPAAEITIQSVDISDNKVTTVLRITDARYNFNGFRAYYFSLAGEKKSHIARVPDYVEVEGVSHEVTAAFKPEHESVEVLLNFEVNRSKEEIEALEDLYLWYRSYRVGLLDLNNK